MAGAGRSDNWGMLGALYQQFFGNAANKRNSNLTQPPLTMGRGGEGTSGSVYQPSAAAFRSGYGSAGQGMLPVSSAFEELRRMGYI